jgi:hypothetical protein
MNGIALEDQITFSAVSPLHKKDFPATQRSTTGHHLLQQFTPPEEYCHNSKNTFQEEKPLAGAMQSHQKNTSPLCWPF